MRMDLGRRSHYAIRCMLHLARQDDGRRLKAREIARHVGVLWSAPCGGADICDVHVSWSKAQAAFREKLAEADLASIAAVRT